MGYLKDQNIIYVDNIKDKLENQTDDNLNYCPNDIMRSNRKTLDGVNYFNFNEIREKLYVSEIYEIPDCPTDGRDFSGCCKKPATVAEGEVLDNCQSGHSTGLLYINSAPRRGYTICHSEEIQSLINMSNNIIEKGAGLEKFFLILLITIVIIVFYTLFSLPYEFWLRYGNSIQCIYYKVKSTCTNMGSKKSDSNGNLTIIEYIFPDNLHNVPYETCKANSQSGGMKGGREKDGKINSNYIEYHENGSKCINVDFGDDVDDRNSRQFPYNLGEYANDPIAKLKARELDIRAKDDFVSAQQAQEKINLDKMKAMMNQQNKDEKLAQNEDLAELRAATSIAKQELANRSKKHDFGRNFRKK